MRILITGGAGCLGSNLIESYLPRGHEIHIIDNFSTGNREVVPEMDNLKIIEGSIADSNLINEIFTEFQPTHVIHSAASYKNPQNWREDCNTNVLGTVNVARASMEIGVKRFINFQTALCYGKPDKVPIPVDHPTAPFTSYGISKTAGEAYLINSELPIISLRLANICGPRLAIGPIPTFYQRLKAGKDCFCSDSIRDFLDMSDFINVIDLVLNPDAPNGIYNVSTGVGNSILEIFNTVAQYLDIEPPKVPILPIENDDIQTVVLDPSFTSESLGWKAKVAFKETIIKQLEWYDLYGVSAIYSHLKLPK